MRRFALGSRGSALALAQAGAVKAAIQAAFDSLAVEIVVIKTTGDRITDSALSAIGGKGLFVRELEQALEAGEIDMAVHSLKDMQTELPASLALGGVLPREDVRDVLVSRGRKKLAELGPRRGPLAAPRCR